jgi:AraC-like DNA-binding protein
MNTNNNLIKTIRVEVEERQAFLDPSLTLASLAERCRTNRTYVSAALMDLGGFFFYVNRLRLTYAATWRKKHRESTVEQVALASGFNSRQSFYNVRRQLTK